MATILLQNVGASTATFTQKLQLAAGSTAYPAGTVFDCTYYTNQNITGTIAITRPNITFIFGAGVFTYTPTSGDIFQVAAQGFTLIGTNRNAKDPGSPAGTTVFGMGGSTGMGYHIAYKVVSVPIGSIKGDCLVVKNCVFKGAQSAYTQVNGNVQYTTQGGGGIFAMESNPGVAGQNLNNVIIENVLLDGAKQHGIFLYGPVACKITNTRVRNAAGHGFYIDGEGTSTSFDTCYASGNYLAGFCLKDAAYSSLLNCASDSNGLGYWLRNTTSTTLVSCGAEANVPRSNIPNNLGIVIPGTSNPVTPAVIINDIGADNVNHIKGTSYFMSGGSYLTLTSPISKDPGGNALATTYPNKRTAHFGFYGSTNNVTITSPRRSGTAPVKYSYRLEALAGSGTPDEITIGETDLTYDPLNPSETPDTNLLPVANILDQGKSNLFIAGGMDQSASDKLTTVSDPYYHEINNLKASSKLTIPTYPSHPVADTDTTVYFNSENKKLYMWQDGVWYDTCCASPTPPPLCYFPGGASIAPSSGGAGSFGTMNNQYGTFNKSIIGNKIFAPWPWVSPGNLYSNSSVGLQSYDMITNIRIDYPNTFDMRIANSLVVGYNPNNEIGLYFAGVHPVAGSGGQQVPLFITDVQSNLPYRSVVGFYNLVTGVCTTGIDVIIENYPQDSPVYFGAYRMMKFDDDDSLYFLSPEDGIIRISTVDWTTISTTPFGSSPSAAIIGPLNAAGMNYGIQTTYFTDVTFNKTAVVRTNNTNSTATVSAINLDGGTIASIPSSNDVTTQNYNKENLISTDPETGNLIVVNCTLRTIAEISPSSGMTLINEWTVGTANDVIGYPTLYTSNGVRYALFYKFTAPVIEVNAPIYASIVCYNLTDNIIDNSVDISNFPGTSFNFTFAGMFMVNAFNDGRLTSVMGSTDIPVYSAESTNIYFPYYQTFTSLIQACKPYNPAG